MTRSRKTHLSRGFVWIKKKKAHSVDFSVECANGEKVRTIKSEETRHVVGSVLCVANSPVKIQLNLPKIVPWIISTCWKTIVQVLAIAKIKFHTHHRFCPRVIVQDSLISSYCSRQRPQSTIGPFSSTISIIRISIASWWISPAQRVHSSRHTSSSSGRPKWMNR